MGRVCPSSPRLIRVWGPKTNLVHSIQSCQKAAKRDNHFYYSIIFIAATGNVTIVITTTTTWPLCKLTVHVGLALILSARARNAGGGGFKLSSGLSRLAPYFNQRIQKNMFFQNLCFNHCQRPIRSVSVTHNIQCCTLALQGLTIKSIIEDEHEPCTNSFDEQPQIITKLHENQPTPAVCFRQVIFNIYRPCASFREHAVCSTCYNDSTNTCYITTHPRLLSFALCLEWINGIYNTPDTGCLECYRPHASVDTTTPGIDRKHIHCRNLPEIRTRYMP